SRQTPRNSRQSLPRTARCVQCRSLRELPGILESGGGFLEFPGRVRGGFVVTRRSGSALWFNSPPTASVPQTGKSAGFTCHVQDTLFRRQLVNLRRPGGTGRALRRRGGLRRGRGRYFGFAVRGGLVFLFLIRGQGESRGGGRCCSVQHVCLQV